MARRHQPEGVRRGGQLQHTVGIASLDAVGTPEPQRSIAAGLQIDPPRVAAHAQQPVTAATAARQVARQRIATGHPYLAATVFGDGHGARTQVIGAVVDAQVAAPAHRVNALQAPAIAGDPHPPAMGGRQGQHVVAIESGPTITGGRQQRELAPPRGQVPQALAAADPPQAADPVLQGMADRGRAHHGAGVSTQRHRLRRLPARVKSQSGCAGAPEVARATAQHRHRRALRHPMQLAIAPPVHALRCVHPHPAVRIGPEHAHVNALVVLQRHLGETMFLTPQCPCRRPDPQPALAVGDQGSHPAHGATVQLQRHALPAAVRMPCEQAVVEGTHPHHTVGGAGDLHDADAGQDHRAIARHALDLAAISRQRQQALRGGRQPELVLRIQMQRAYVHIQQPLFPSPRAETVTIKAQESIVAGEPQITVAVFHDRTQRRGRQRLGGAQRPGPGCRDGIAGQNRDRQPERETQHHRSPAMAH